MIEKEMKMIVDLMIDQGVVLIVLIKMMMEKEMEMIVISK